MALEIMYRDSRKKISFRLPPVDIDIAMVLAKKGFESEMNLLLDVDDVDRERSVERVLLLSAVLNISDSLARNPDLLPYMYGTKMEFLPGVRLSKEEMADVLAKTPPAYGGGFGGIRINGELYSLECGLDECVLARIIQDSNGLGREVDRKDIRHLKCIETDNWGTITLYKKKASTSLLKILNKLQKFLEQSDEEFIWKKLF